MNVGIAIAATLFLGLFYSWTSRINGIFFFGRSLAPELAAGAEAQAITRQYRVLILAATVFAVLAAWSAARFGGRYGLRLSLAAPLGLAAAFWFIFAQANRRARSLAPLSSHPPANVVQVALNAPSAYTVPGWGLTVLPVALSLAAFAISVLVAAQRNGVAAGWAVLNTRIETHHLDMLLGMAVGMLSSASVLIFLT